MTDRKERSEKIAVAAGVPLHSSENEELAMARENGAQKMFEFLGHRTQQVDAEVSLKQLSAQICWATSHSHDPLSAWTQMDNDDKACSVATDFESVVSAST